MSSASILPIDVWLQNSDVMRKERDRLRAGTAEK